MDFSTFSQHYGKVIAFGFTVATFVAQVFTFCYFRFRKPHGRKLNIELRKQSRRKVLDILWWASYAPSRVARLKTIFWLARFRDLPEYARKWLNDGGVEINDANVAESLRDEFRTAWSKDLFATLNEIDEQAGKLTPSQDTMEAAFWAALAAGVEKHELNTLAKAIRAVAHRTACETWLLLDSNDHASLLQLRIEDMTKELAGLASKVEQLHGDASGAIRVTPNPLAQGEGRTSLASLHQHVARLAGMVKLLTFLAVCQFLAVIALLILLGPSLLRSASGVP